VIRVLDVPANGRQIEPPTHAVVLLKLCPEDGSNRKTYKVIAAELKCTEAVVKKRALSIMRKLGKRNVDELNQTPAGTVQGATGTRPRTTTQLRRKLEKFDEDRPFVNPIPDSMGGAEYMRRNKQETAECPHCGHDLAGEQTRCPGCGEDVSLIQ